MTTSAARAQHHATEAEPRSAKRAENNPWAQLNPHESHPKRLHRSSGREHGKFQIWRRCGRQTIARTVECAPRSTKGTLQANAAKALRSSATIFSDFHPCQAILKKYQKRAQLKRSLDRAKNASGAFTARSDDDEDALGFADDGGFDSDADEDFDDATRREVAMKLGGAGGSSPMVRPLRFGSGANGADPDSSSYSDMVRAHVEKYFQSASEWASETKLSRARKGVAG